MTTRYFRPGVGITARAGDLKPVDETPQWSDVTQLRAVPIVDAETDGRTLEGIASPFNTETIIDSWWEGRFVEVIRPGAFTRTIGEDRIIMQYDHGGSAVPGATPIAAIDRLEETDDGLYVRARLRDTWDVAPVRDAIADGSLKGMSIQFRVRDERITDPDDPEAMSLREILDVRLYELGPVTWPAYPTTTVGVRMVEAGDDLDGHRQDGPPPDSTGVGQVRDNMTRLQVARARLHL